jgi:hypothetical protein
MYLTRNQAYEQSYRGFESHPFRIAPQFAGAATSTRVMTDGPAGLIASAVFWHPSKLLLTYLLPPCEPPSAIPYWTSVSPGTIPIKVQFLTVAALTWFSTMSFALSPVNVTVSIVTLAR